MARCQVPGARRDAEDSQVMAPATGKLTPVGVSPTNRERHVQRGKYHDRSFRVALWKYKPEGQAGRPFPQREEKEHGPGGGDSSSVMMLGHGVRSQDGQERDFIGNPVLEQMAGQAAGRGARKD